MPEDVSPDLQNVQTNCLKVLWTSCIWWIPCLKLRIYTPYIWLWPSLRFFFAQNHTSSFLGPSEWPLRICQPRMRVLEFSHADQYILLQLMMCSQSSIFCSDCALNGSLDATGNQAWLFFWLVIVESLYPHNCICSVVIVPWRVALTQLATRHGCFLTHQCRVALSSQMHLLCLYCALKGGLDATGYQASLFFDSLS